MSTVVSGLCHCQKVEEKEEGSTAHRSDQDPSYVLGAGPKRKLIKLQPTGDKTQNELN